jgi:hypothetical protein
MTASSPQPAPAPALSHYSSEDLIRAQLKGVLEALRAEERIQAYHFRRLLEPHGLPTLAVTVLADGADYDAEMTVRMIVTRAMRDSGYFVDLDVETYREYYASK